MIQDARSHEIKTCFVEVKRLFKCFIEVKHFVSVLLKLSTCLNVLLKLSLVEVLYSHLRFQNLSDIFRIRARLCLLWEK
jgi:hypothetical protein